MLIKDIRSYRTFYKEQVLETKESNRNEHFIGVKGQNEDGTSIFGYFSITHGDKIKGASDGIKGFLEGFLEMAKDTQAVYEFLQNAVDSDSTRFTMIWGNDPEDGHDYLLVINNGRQFDFAAVRSILNVGVSTKTPDQHTIGRFGIGFKLAHRLVGKDNGLDELINKNYGPILYSWTNNDLRHLINYREEAIEPINPVFRKATSSNSLKTNQDEFDSYTYVRTDPWLFKILITNFPAQPDEPLLDINLKPTTTAFTKGEVTRLSKWLRKHQDVIPLEDHKEGSLFFIRLGEDKRQHLEDENLEDGIKFSLSVLNHTSQQRVKGLRQVHLKGTDIQSADLDFEEFIVSKDSEDFRYIRFDKKTDLNEDEQKVADKDSDIQLLIGYTSFDKASELFRNAPNFYLYFPLSVEKHNLMFILHSNAFYKSSSRTTLQVGTKDKYGINERLLVVFANRMNEKLEAWSKSDILSVREKFLTLYPNLLLSRKSDDNDKAWINSPLIVTLHNFLIRNIPVVAKDKFRKFEIVENPSKVWIKAINFDFDPHLFDLDFDWFFWGNDPLLRSAVKEILMLKEFSILDLLFEKGVFDKINELLITNPDSRATLLQEIDNRISEVTGADNLNTVAIFKENFLNIRLFEFENGEFKSINDLLLRDELDAEDQTVESNKYLLLFSAIEPLKSLLQKAGFIVTKLGLSNHPQIESFIRGRQLIFYNDYKKLNEYLSNGFAKANFTASEKFTIFEILESANENENLPQRITRMQLLSLFSNEQGDIVPLGSLIKETPTTWLKPFEINKAEYQERLDRYLVATDTEAYSKVVIPFWHLIISDKLGLIRKDISAFYSDICSFQELTKQTQSLSDQVFIPLIDRFSEADADIYYQSHWHSFEAGEYAKLKVIFKKLFKKELPDHRALPFLKKSPFNLADSNFESLSLENEHILSKEEADLIGKAMHTADLPFFDSYIFESHQLLYKIRPVKENELQVYCGNDIKTTSYIYNYHKELIICPSITGIDKMIELRDTNLVAYLIDEWRNSSNSEADALEAATFEKRTDLLTDIILSKDDDLKTHFLNCFQSLVINLSDFSGFSYIKNAFKIALSFEDLSIPRGIILPLLQFKLDELVSFTISDILVSQSDSIFFGEANEFNIKLSEIFTNDEKNLVRHLETVIAKLNAEFQLDKARLHEFFNLGEENDKASIFDRLKAVLQTQDYIANAAQLSFLLLYKKFEDSELKLFDYYILTKTHIHYLEGTFAIQSTGFTLFDPDYYLDENTYMGVATLLNLSPITNSFKSGEVSLYTQPSIENNTLLGPRLKENLSDIEHITLLEFLLNNSSQTLPSHISLEQTWKNVLGIDPGLFVSAKYAYRIKEKLPVHLHNWIWSEKDEWKKKRKSSLLAALGFNLSWSDINTLREVLLDSTSNRTFLVNNLDNIPIELLSNTLFLIASEYPDYKIRKNAKHFDLIREVILKCIQNEGDELLLPVNTKNEGEYILINYKDESIYNYNINKHYELLRYTISFHDLIHATEGRFYDATSWIETNWLSSVLEEIEIKEVINYDHINETAMEWNEKFYDEWKLSYPEKALFLYEALPLDLYFNDIFIKRFGEEEYIHHNDIIYCPDKFSPKKIFDDLKYKNYLSYNILDHLKFLYTKYDMKVKDLFDNQDLEPAIKKAVDDKRKELENLAHLQELRENLFQDEYSWKWFSSFLELQILRSNEGDNIQPEQEISFFAADWEPDSERIIRFRDPNRTVTPTIEYCTDFRAILYTNAKTPIEVKIQSISKKGQVVLAMLSRTRELSGIDLKDIKRIELKFSRTVDLLLRLQNAFNRMAEEKNWSDDFNLKSNLTPNLKFIFGPPGTGKTTLLAKRLISLMETEPNAKILVLTPTNKSADVLADRILEKSSDDDYEWLVRYGATFSNEIIEKGLLKDSSTFIYEAYQKCVFISTVHRIPYEEFTFKMEDGQPQRIRISDAQWDYVVFDEASMIPLTYITYAIHRFQNNAAEFWIGGDPLQIPPVVDIEDEDLPDSFNKEANIYSMIALDSFDENEQQQIPDYGSKIENLLTQYRSVESIGRLFSHFSYQDKLNHHRANGNSGNKDSRPLPENIKNLGIKPITLIRYPVNQDDTVFNPARLNKSPYQLYASILTFEIIQYFEKSIPAQEHWNIGIVCPYRSQASLVNKMIESLNLKSNITVITDTVHGFQGDECDIIFFIVNTPSFKISGPEYGAFIHKHYLMNVAISRAKDYLVILYPDDNTKGIPNLVKINHQTPGSIEDIIINKLNLKLSDITIQAEAIEEKIFNEKNHIEKNIFTNKHQLINVYNIAEKKYLVRESSTAIDIQFKNK